MLLRVLSQPSRPGYMAWKFSAEVRDSLAKYKRPPNSMTRLSKSSKNSPRPGRMGKSTQTFQPRSEEHTSELQSRGHLVCRLLLEKKKDKNTTHKQSTYRDD